MAFVNAQKSRLVVGQVPLSGYTRQFGVDTSSEMLDVSVLESTAKAFIPGQTMSGFSIGLILDTDTTANGLWDRLTSWKSAAPVAVTFGPSGLAALSEVFLLGAYAAQVGMTSTASGTVDASVNGQPDGPADAGYSLEDFTAMTETTNGTARDLMASSANGGVAHLHVSAFSGLTSNDVTIEHSANGTSGWATVGTFTQVTGVTSQRLVIAAGTTVNRYLRVVDTIVGTGSCTRAVSFARR